MDKLEKVIKGMECCIERMTITGECDYDCPYYHNPHGCKVMMLKDAISLMKAQEPMEPIKTKYFTTLCGQCRHEIDRLAGDKFCPHCGQAVKWE